MHYVEHIIGAINVFDITVVVVVPAHWPSLVVPEPIAAVLEAVVPADHLGTPHVERVVMPEMGIVTDISNAAIVAATVAAVVRNGLCLLPSGRLYLALHLLGALRLRLVPCLLGALRLRLVLCLLGALRLRLVLCLLSALRLRLVLCLLRALWLRLVLCLLGALWLRLVLRRLGFLGASALFLLAFLCECRNGSCEKQ